MDREYTHGTGRERGGVVNVPIDQPRPPPRWLCFLALWLLFSMVWASQLYFGGHVKSWSKALGQEALYWLSWGVILPLVFLLCRRLHDEKLSWGQYVLGVLGGAIVVAFLQPAILKSIAFAQSWLQWRLSISHTPTHPFLSTL